MAEGGTQALAWPELLAKLHPWAARIEVQVDKEQVTFIGRCHRDHLEAFYPLFRDVLIHPRLAERDFQRLRKQTLERLTREVRTANDEELSKLVLESVIFEGHPYGHPTFGTEAGLRALTLEDVVAHRAAVYTRGRVTIGLAGAIDDAFAERVRQDLTAALPAGDGPPPAIPPAPTGAPKLVVVDQPDGPSTAIAIGQPIDVTRTEADFPALALVASYFGEHRQFHGVLFQSIREARGMNYGDYAYAEAFIQEGWSRFPRVNLARHRQQFSVWIRPVPNADRHFALRIARWQLDRLLRDGLTGAAVARTRAFLDGYLYLRQQTDSRRLGYALDDRFYALPRPPAERLRAAWARSDAAAVNRALRRHIHPEAATMVVITPDATGFVAAVLAETPSPKTYATPPPEAILAEDREISKYALGLTAADVRVVSSADLFAGAPVLAR